MATEEIKKTRGVESDDMDPKPPDQAASTDDGYAKAQAEYQAAERLAKTTGNARAIAKMSGVRTNIDDLEDEAFKAFDSAGRFASDGSGWSRRGRRDFRAIVGLRTMDATRRLF